MDDRTFIATLNSILEGDRTLLQPLEGKATPADTVAEWAKFLETAMRRGVRLSDPRWGRLTVSRSEPWTVLDLQREGAPETEDDFFVGLQLLMGMFEEG